MYIEGGKKALSAILSLKQKQKMHANNNISSLPVNTGWKYYNTIKKKAMEQEFSWSGLVLSLSIAFFVVLMSAMLMNIMHQKLVMDKKAPEFEQKIYHLEYLSDNYVNLKELPKVEMNYFC